MEEPAVQAPMRKQPQSWHRFWLILRRKTRPVFMLALKISNTYKSKEKNK